MCCRAEGKPPQHGFTESFHRNLRDALRNEEVCDTLDDARHKHTLWRYHDNNRSRALLRDTMPGSGQAALIAQNQTPAKAPISWFAGKPLSRYGNTCRPCERESSGRALEQSEDDALAQTQAPESRTQTRKLPL
ncbi:MAG: hypothetical protein ACI90E_000324 [Yoonia sp.]|jgi:hypothetical protein